MSHLGAQHQTGQVVLRILEHLRASRSAQQEETVEQSCHVDAPLLLVVVVRLGCDNLSQLDDVGMFQIPDAESTAQLEN